MHLVCAPKVPICASLSLRGRPFCAPYYTYIQGSLHTFSYCCCYRFLKAKRAHHIDLYWVVFHLLQNFSARFFFLLLCRYCLLLYTSHERLMILNLACFKAFCSSVGRCRAERAVVDVVRSNLAARRRPDREATNQPTSLRLPALFLP